MKTTLRSTVGGSMDGGDIKAILIRKTIMAKIWFEMKSEADALFDRHQ